MNRFILLLLGLLTTAITFAQVGTLAASDSTTIEEDSVYVTATEDEDSTYTFEEEESLSAKKIRGTDDTSRLVTRAFTQTTIQDLKSDSSLQYTEAPTIAESLWDRFLQWINQFIESLFDSAVNTNWGRLFAYLLGIAILVVIIMMVLKVNAFKIFYSGQGANTIQHHILEENIHEIDFDKEIQNAIDQKDYRRGVRLVFLYALKLLADKQLIHWEQGKTNHEYLAELKGTELKTGFNELNFYFDYAWYGNFSVNLELFKKVQGIFNDWKGKVK